MKITYSRRLAGGYYAQAADGGPRVKVESVPLATAKIGTVAYWRAWHAGKEVKADTRQEAVAELLELLQPAPAPAEEAIEAAHVTQVNMVFEDELEGPDFTPRTVIEFPKGLTFAAWKEQNLTPDWSNWYTGEGLDGSQVFGYSAELPRRTAWVFVRPAS